MTQGWNRDSMRCRFFLELLWIYMVFPSPWYFFQGKDSFGDYVNLHPRVANSIWMPDIFIDQVNPIDLKYKRKCKKKVERKFENKLKCKNGNLKYFRQYNCASQLISHSRPHSGVFCLILFVCFFWGWWVCVWDISIPSMKWDYLQGGFKGYHFQW